MRLLKDIDDLMEMVVEMVMEVVVFVAAVVAVIAIVAAVMLPVIMGGVFHIVRVEEEQRDRAKRDYHAAVREFREKYPDFLDPDHDRAAEPLLGALDTAERRLGLAARSDRSKALNHGVTRLSPLAAKRLRDNAQIIGELKEFIHPKGSNPNLTRRIDALDEE